MMPSRAGANPSGELGFVTTLPEGLVYEPNFLTPDEETQLLDELRVLLLQKRAVHLEDRLRDGNERQRLLHVA